MEVSRTFNEGERFQPYVFVALEKWKCVWLVEAAMRAALLGLMFVACAPVAPRPTVLHVSLDRRDEFEVLVRSMEEAAKARGVPGGAIAVIEKGELAHAAGFGLRHAQRAEGVTPNTTFRIASISKTLLAATALSLVDSGELKLEAEVNTLVPQLMQPVTLRQLLNHTSGLADRGELACEGSIANWLSAYAPTSQRTPPGAVWNYANPNYLIVAAAIESVTGRRFEDVVKERLFADLPSATYEPREAMAHEPSFMHPARGAPQALDAVDCVLLRAAGGVMIDVVDFAKVLSRIDGQRMLEGAVDIRRGPNMRYGLGVYSALGRDGAEGFSHAGGMDGVQTFFAAFPDFAVVAFFNGNASLMKDLSNAVAVYRGVTSTPPQQSPPSFEPFTGTWRDDEHELDVDVSMRDGKLWARFRRDSLDVREELRWLGGDTFIVKWPVGDAFTEIEATFFPNDYLVTRVGVATRP